MTARRPVVILAETLERSGAISGPTRAIHPEIRKLGIIWQWDARRSRYLVPLPVFNDVLAALEAAGHRIEVVGAALW